MLLAIPLLAAAAAATDPETANAAEAPLVLDPITVEASKRPLAAEDIAASVTVIGADRIERELVENIDDLVRYEPGVDVVDQGSRFGRAGFTIRGIGGNRVLVEVDGTPVSDAFSIGSFSNASRDFVDVDMLRQVEIIRGPSSALFGSDAIGGVVSFVTRDPGDFLLEQDRYFGFKGGYYDVDESWMGGATVAGRAGEWSALLTGTWRDGHERNHGLADPMDYDSLSGLGKVVYGDLLGAPLEVSVGHFETDSYTDVVSQRGVQDFSEQFGFPYLIVTSNVTGDDTRDRSRLGLEQEWRDGAGFTDYLRWRAYYQDSETTQDTLEERSTIIMGEASPVSRTRRFRFSQELTGFELNAASHFETGALTHDLAYGFELEHADTAQLRDGTETDLLTGETSSTVGPDAFPVRDFPLSETDSAGVYVQDSIAMGAVTVIPALRWDRYELTPQPDPIFITDNPDIETVPLDDSEVSPKLGLLWAISDQWQLFGQYSEGFRAPPVNDVNVGFTNLQFGYTTIPNPDLKSETSRGVELGLRYRGDDARWELSAFHSEYDDFIQSFQAVGFVDNLIVFQSINIDEVEIDGVELRGRWAPGFFPEGVSLRYAASWTEGDNRQTGQPINTIAPPSAVLGLNFDSPDGRWGASLVGRASEAQDRVDDSAGPLLMPAGYGLVDVTAWWDPTPGLRLVAGVFNAGDKTYTRWLNVAGLPVGTPDPERFESAGRNYSVTMRWSF